MASDWFAAIHDDIDDSLKCEQKPVSGMFIKEWRVNCGKEAWRLGIGESERRLSGTVSHAKFMQHPNETFQTVAKHHDLANSRRCRRQVTQTSQRIEVKSGNAEVVSRASKG